MVLSGLLKQQINHARRAQKTLTPIICLPEADQTMGEKNLSRFESGIWLSSTFRKDIMGRGHPKGFERLGDELEPDLYCITFEPRSLM